MSCSRGTTVHGQLVYSSSAGRFAGSSELTLELTDIVIDEPPIRFCPAPMRSRAAEKGSTQPETLSAGPGSVRSSAASQAEARVRALESSPCGGRYGRRYQERRAGSIPSESLVEFRLDQPASLPAPE